MPDILIDVMIAVGFAVLVFFLFLLLWYDASWPDDESPW